MMKQFVTLAIIALTLSACVDTQNNVDFTDSKTKMTVKGTGLSCEDVSIEIGGDVVERNNFYQGEKVTINFDNFLGLKEVNKKRYPNLSVTIKDSQGKVINSGEDLLKDKDLDFSSLKISAFFMVPFDYVEGEIYNLSIKIQDKKGKGVLTADMPFTIAPNPNIRIKSNALSAKRIYLWDKENDLVITNNEILKDKSYYIIVDSLRGLTEIDAMVHPVLPMEIIDNNGDTLLSMPDLINLTEEGIEPDKLLNIPFTFSVNGNVENPIHIKTGIWDQKSDGYLEIKTSVKAK